MIGYIYQILNTQTKQSYIGQTVDINRRKRTHFGRLKNNTHENPKLQASWNKYGSENFEFFYWSFNISSLDELNILECKYIEEYDGLTEGFNLVPGGGKPPLHKKVKDDDIVTFLCVQKIFGDGYGKSCEQIFGWAIGTASSAKRRIRYLEAIQCFDKMSDEEIEIRAKDFFESQKLGEVAFQRQLTQGGCEKAYLLSTEDFFFAFCAQEMGYKYTPVAKFLGIKPATVKDWFNGRSRRKEREEYKKLTENEKQLYKDKVCQAKLGN